MMANLYLTNAVRAAGGAAAAAIAARFLDERYGVLRDVGQILQDRAFRKRMGARINHLGDDVTIYRMLELAQPDATALWFEGRSWTYSEMKAGDSPIFAPSIELFTELNPCF
jgi:hypothetical protein